MKFKLLFAGILISISSFSQPSIDGVAGIVGKKMILKSDIEAELIQMKARNENITDDAKCYIYEKLLLNNLLVNQTYIDSIEVTDAQVDGELNRRLAMFERQIGSREAMEKYFRKTYDDIKKSMRHVVKDQLLVENMRANITQDVFVTPAEVRQFYRKLPKDSLPLVESETEIEQIVKIPKPSKEKEQKVIKRLNEFRAQVLAGKKDFETLAILYSDDPGSAEKGGNLGWIRRSDLVPEFAGAAFKLKKEGDISEVVKTDFGYHIIRFLGRKGEAIEVQHILMKPQVSILKMNKLKQELDSVAELIRTKKITFQEAVEKYSDDENSKNNNGLLLNPYTGDAKFESKHLDPSTSYILKQMEIGEISKPFLTQNMKGSSEVKIIRLKSRTEAHIADIKTDYQRIKNMALETKKTKAISDWIKEKQKNTYVKIYPEYMKCNFKYSGWTQ